MLGCPPPSITTGKIVLNGFSGFTGFIRPLKGRRGGNVNHRRDTRLPSSMSLQMRSSPSLYSAILGRRYGIEGESSFLHFLNPSSSSSYVTVPYAVCGGMNLQEVNTQPSTRCLHTWRGVMLVCVVLLLPQSVHLTVSSSKPYIYFGCK